MARIPSKFLCVLPLVVSLGACGASTIAGMEPDRTPGQNKPLLEALQAANQNLRPTPLADFPVSGGADYQGFAQFGRNSPGATNFPTEIVGVADLRIDVTNSSPALSGTFTDFDDPFGTYTGTLDVTATGSEILGGSVLANANVTGTLTRNTGETMTINADIAPRTFGPDATYLIGGGNFAVTYDGTQTDVFLSVNAVSDTPLGN